MFFVNYVDADADANADANADEKREKRRHFTDFSLNVFDYVDSIDESFFIVVSFRKKSRRKSLLIKTNKKNRNFITRKHKKQIKKTRQLN